MNAATPAPRREESAEQRWNRFSVLKTGEDYLASLRNRGTRLFLFGELIDEPADHPIIKPSINALRASYDLAIEDPDLATAWSPLIDAQVNRFLHIVESPADLVKKNKMQRRMGQITGTCFQRCTGLDTISVLHSITYKSWHIFFHVDRLLTNEREQRHHFFNDISAAFFTFHNFD